MYVLINVGRSAAGRELSETVTVGFRSVELVQDPLPGGASFYFRVNGLPIFSKVRTPRCVLPKPRAMGDRFLGGRS